MSNGDHHMTKAQTKKLDIILAKLETLQNEVECERVRERMGKAKTELMRIQYID